MPSLYFLGLNVILHNALLIVTAIAGLYFTFRAITLELLYRKQFGHLPEFLRPSKSYWRRYMK